MYSFKFFDNLHKSKTVSVGQCFWSQYNMAHSSLFFLMLRLEDRSMKSLRFALCVPQSINIKARNSQENKYQLLAKSRLQDVTEPAVFVSEVATQHDVSLSLTRLLSEYS